MTEPITHTLSTPGAELVYDVYPADSAQDDSDTSRPTPPPLLLVGTPMDARGFVTLAGHFPDRTVITYDPRNVGRSRRTDPDHTPTPEDHAEDLHAIIGELPGIGELRGTAGGPVDLFGSSGGAINSLALTISHPEDLRIVVAHEPPVFGVLPDAERLNAVGQDIYDTYQRSGFGAGMAKFIAMVSETHPFGADYLQRPGPDPAVFGLPTEDDGRRDDPVMNNMSTIPVWQLDLDALRATPATVVLAVGEDSGETMAARAPRAIATALGRSAVVFPGDHSGFLGGEYGQTGKPDGFAAALRRVLTETP